MHRSVAAPALFLLVAAACASESDQSATPSSSSAASFTTTAATAGPTTTSPTTASAGPPRLRAVKLADFDGALALAVREGDDALYVGEKGGRVKALRGERMDPVPVLDLSRHVSSGAEQGLLGAVFSPEGDHLYVNFTNRAGDTRVVEYPFDNGRADPASGRELLAVDQPFSNHNGGHLAFGPDGMLYIALGDGGSGGDPLGNAQRLDTLLGKLLRIDPRPSGGRPYTVPPDNPFVERQGARPEIWAYGLRNPWRFSFDRGTGALWTGDVGQGTREEVNKAARSANGGENYGWNRYEGRHRFAGSAAPGDVAPVYDYAREDGNCAVTGGYVYRGRRIAGLHGRYVFADFCKGEVLGLFSDGERHRAVGLGPRVPSLASFGEDAEGELYALSLDSGLFRLEV